MTRVIAWALRTSLGGTVDEVVARLLAGDRATGQIATAPAMDSRHARFLDRLPLHALEVGHEAAAAAGAAGGERLGVFVGVGGLRVAWAELVPVLAAQRDDGGGAWARGLDKIHPFWMLRHLSNNAHALLAADLDARGEGGTFGGATSGATAIAAAARALAAGVIDTAVVLAYDTLLAPEMLADLAHRGALDVSPGEAAAALVLVDGDGPALAHVAAATGADGELGEPGHATIARVAARLGVGAPVVAIASATNGLGAAAPVVQSIVLGELLRRGELPGGIALCLATGAPGLAAAVRVEAAR